MTNYKVEYWLNDEEIKAIEYSDYWNDKSQEVGKRVWNIVDNDFDKMEKYLQKTGLSEDLKKCVDFLEYTSRKLKGRGIDLACGYLESMNLFVNAF